MFPMEFYKFCSRHIRKEIKMYRFHCVLLINFLALAYSIFAAEDFMAVGVFLENGYYKMANLKTSDSLDGIYMLMTGGMGLVGILHLTQDYMLEKI